MTHRAIFCLLGLLACATPTPEEPAERRTAPVPRPPPEPVPELTTPGAVHDILGRALERGSCREHRLRIDGKTVLDAKTPTDAALLEAQLGSQPMERAAISAGLLWDARASVTNAAGLAKTLTALHSATVADLRALDCRKLKAVQGDGVLYNARGDALALFTRLDDPALARRMLLEVAETHPEVKDPGLAALGDEEALHRVSKAALAQLCAGRTWETTWMLRALDTGRLRGSLLPLGQQQTGACELLAGGADPDAVTPRDARP